MQRREILKGLAAAAGLTVMPRGSRAAAWPTTGHSLIVPYPPGGTSDAQGRAIAEFMESTLGQNILVENIPGASGVVATNDIYNRGPDGKALLLQTSSSTVVVPQLKTGDYDPRNLVRPVCSIFNHPIAIIAHKDSKYNTIQDVIDDSKARPDEVTYGTAGSASMYTMAAEIINLRAGTTLRHIPYKGAAQYTVDLLAGRIDLAVGTLATSMGNPNVKPLIVGLPTRSSVNPDVQTAVEAGFPELVLPREAGIFAHIDTPDDVIEAMSDSFAGIADNATFKARLPGLNLEPNYMNSVEFSAALDDEYAMIARLIKEIGMTPAL